VTNLFVVSCSTLGEAARARAEMKLNAATSSAERIPDFINFERGM
jgi:hypothetical protein